MGMKNNDFHYTKDAQEVIFGSGAIEQLGEAAARFGWQRLMLCTGPSLRKGGQVALIEQGLGPRLAATYDRVQAHVPDFQLAEALKIAAEAQVEAIIGLGGGSPIGMAKAVSLALEERLSGQPARAAFPTDQPSIPTIAIPTTYAGSEMTPVYGVTHQVGDSSRKITVRDAKITPKLAIYDPLLTLDLPPQVTATTGINALAHCIEALYSISRNPLSTAAALEGIRYINQALPRCYSQGDDLEARTEMLVGAHLAGTALASVAMGLHHGTCHVLGGTAGVPHGVANCIILPHAMRFNLDAAAPQLARAALAMGLAVQGQSAEAAGEAAAQRVFELVAQLGAAQRLRDAGVKESDLPHLAREMLNSRAVQSNPKPLTDAAQAEALLQAAW